MLSAIPLLGASYGVASSQSLILNGQLQTGDVISAGTLDVVDQTDDTTNVVNATGNSLSGSVVSGSLEVQSTQAISGLASSDNRVTVATDGGEAVVTSTATTGNTLDVGITGGGQLTGSYNQSSTGSTVYSHSQITGNAARTTNMSASNQAIANSAGFGVTDSSADVSVVQSNSATVNSDGGVIWQYITGQATLSSAAIGNNVTSATAGTTTQAISATQSNTSTLLQAAHWGAYGTSQDTVTSATATANNTNLTNTGGSLDTTVNQSNSSYVRAQAEETSFAYGGASSVAYGVGNSSLSGNQGPATFIDNTQTNTGLGIQSIANFSGNSGYDAQASSTAIGNAAAGYSCANCQSTMQVRNNQTNSAGVGATSSVTVSGSGRSSRNTTTAVGNTGSFYVTSPGP